MKANQIPAPSLPMMSAANVGVTKIPGSIADNEMMTTPESPTLRLSVFLIVSAPLPTRESSLEIAITKSPIYSTKGASIPLQVNLGYILLHFFGIHITGFRNSNLCDYLHLNSDWSGQCSNGQCCSSRSVVTEGFGPHLVVTRKVSIHINEEGCHIDHLLH